eukprot:SAG31_NODE_1566_length_7856_cov_8.045607_6_plen_103_part_00
MLEVGRVMGGDYNWNRAHFGAWVVTSAPLILGMDLQNSTMLDSVIDFVTNPEAIAVNQVRLQIQDSAQIRAVPAKICLFQDASPLAGMGRTSRAPRVERDGR